MSEKQLVIHSDYGDLIEEGDWEKQNLEAY